jgi:hypothetical protein
MAKPNDLYKALYDTVKFEVVEVNGPPKETEKQIRFIGRVRSHSKVWAQQIVDALIREAHGNTNWSIDISRYYLLYKNEVIWAWRVIIQVLEGSREDTLSEIVRLVRGSSRPTARAPVQEIEEIQLVAPSQTRTANPDNHNGKGARYIKEMRK